MAQQGLATSRSSAATASTTARRPRPARSSTSPATATPTRYSTVAAIHDIPDPAEFAADYKAEVQRRPGSYSAPGYACTQVFLQALKAVGAGAVATWRSCARTIRAYVADPANTYDTVLGKVGFDANGDTTQQTISYYQFDAARRKDWKFLKQRDFTARPRQVSGTS